MLKSGRLIALAVLATVWLANAGLVSAQNPPPAQPPATINPTGAPVAAVPAPECTTYQECKELRKKKRDAERKKRDDDRKARADAIAAKKTAQQAKRDAREKDLEKDANPTDSSNSFNSNFFNSSSSNGTSNGNSNNSNNNNNNNSNGNSNSSNIFGSH